MAGAEVFHEPLGAFQHGCVGARAEGLDPFGFQPVHEPKHQRGFRADDHQVDGVVFREGDQRIDVFRADCDAFGVLRDPGIARGAIELVAERGAGDGPAKRVLAATAADDQNAHDRTFLA